MNRLVFQLPSVKWTVEPILIQSARGDVYLEDSLKISALHLSSVSKPASLDYIINSLTIILCIDSAGWQLPVKTLKVNILKKTSSPGEYFLTSTFTRYIALGHRPLEKPLCWEKKFLPGIIGRNGYISYVWFFFLR